MKWKTIFTATAAVAAFLSGSGLAAAQGQRWACEWGYYTHDNPNTGQAAGSFLANIYGDGNTNGGRADGQGSQGSGYGRENIVFEANWRLDGRAFMLDGRQSISGGPPVPFKFTSNIVSNTEMAMTADMGSGQVLVTRCQLQGTL